MTGLLDRTLAVLAMLGSIGPLLTGVLGPRSHISVRRALAVALGGAAAVVGTVGLLALQSLVVGRTFYLPTWLGGSLSFFGGMLGTATILASRGPAPGTGGMSEDGAIRTATQAIAMSLYVAAPILTLAALGLTRLLRASLPWTVTRHRWGSVLEGLALVALCAVPRDPTLGGLRMESPLP